MRLYTGQVTEFEYQGFDFRVTVEQDIDMGAPWEEHDGHGVVSDWTRRDKKPSERILWAERGSKRYYDVSASIARAHAEGWGLSDKDRARLMERLGNKTVVRAVRSRVENGLRVSDIDTVVETVRDFEAHPLTDREIKAEAVRRDFENLRAWCADEWTWQYIRVQLLDADGEPVPGFEDSIGGVEGSDNDYLIEMAYQCADEVIRQYDKAKATQRAEDAEAEYWAARDTRTL